jgi:serine/threonine-protein kinase
MSVAPGDIIARKYRVERVVGAGAMGVVVAATHTQLRQRVAIKLLQPEIAANPEAVARFLREARGAVQIQSQHVARVLDVGELDSGAPYIVMEYLEGSDLAAVLRKSGTLSASVVADYVLQICEALSEAHVLGIVHRDLKPANLFVIHRPDGTPSVKVLDFGISKASASDPTKALTKASSFLGSPLYSAPEQLKSTRDADARADIWSLGIIMYEALSGRVPFNGANVGEIATRIYQMPAPPLHVRRRELPRALCDVVMRCLEKKPEKRFANVAELARALKPFAGDSEISVERISRVLDGSRPSLPRAPSVEPPPPTPRIVQAPTPPQPAAPWTQAPATQPVAPAPQPVASGALPTPYATASPTVQVTGSQPVVPPLAGFAPPPSGGSTLGAWGQRGGLAEQPPAKTNTAARVIVLAAAFTLSLVLVVVVAVAVVSRRSSPASVTATAAATAAPTEPESPPSEPTAPTANATDLPVVGLAPLEPAASATASAGPASMPPSPPTAGAASAAVATHPLQPWKPPATTPAPSPAPNGHNPLAVDLK